MRGAFMLLPFQGAGIRGYAYPGCRSACPGLCAFWAFSPFSANGWARGFVGTAFFCVALALVLPPAMRFWLSARFPPTAVRGTSHIALPYAPRLCAAGLAARALRTAGTGHLPAHAVAKRRETSFSLLQKARLLHNERGFVYTKRIFTRLSLRQTKNVITFARNWLNYTRTRRRASRPPKPTRDAHAVYI